MITYGVYGLNDNDAYNMTLFALQNGCRSIDTAQLYKNEHAVGRAIKDSKINRNEIFLTTKISFANMKKASYEQCILQSVRELGTYVDLILLHGYQSNDDWPKLVSSYHTHRDKIRYIGVSNYNLNHLIYLLQHTNVIPYANQIEYSPFFIRDDLVEACHKNNIKIYAHTIFLKGAITDNIHHLIISWLLSKNILPIFGSRNKDHIMSNLTVGNDRDFSPIDDILKKDRITLYPKHI
jgi:diketogulonate reductase-like aldo/keto reductase